MYDLRAIRENPAWFDAALKRRGLESLSSQVLEMDESRRSSQTQLGELQARRNAASKEIGAAMKDKDTARAHKPRDKCAAADPDTHKQTVQ